MKRLSRILIALFAVFAAIAWCLVPVGIAWLGWAFHGMSDGAASEPVSVPLPRLLLLAVIWMVPMTVFVLMFLNAINVLKGVMRRLAFWYSLVFLITVAGGIAVFDTIRHIGGRWTIISKLIGLAFLLAAGLSFFSFHEPDKDKSPTSN